MEGCDDIALIGAGLVGGRLPIKWTRMKVKEKCSFRIYHVTDFRLGSASLPTLQQ